MRRPRVAGIEADCELISNLGTRWSQSLVYPKSGGKPDHKGHEIIGMTNKSDLNAERAKRRDQWRRRGATWNLRSSANDQARDERLNGLLIAAADICPGAVVLDLGAGSGEPAITAALRVGT